MNDQAVRLDKWLWAARFFKTRGLAQAAIAGGKVEINGARPRASRLLRIGDRLGIRRGEERFEVEVIGLSQRRGPAPEAQRLYSENEESIQARERERQQRRLAGAEISRSPDKHGRRRLRELKRR